MGDPMRGTAWGESFSHSDGQGVSPGIEIPVASEEDIFGTMEIAFPPHHGVEFQTIPAKNGSSDPRGGTPGVRGAFSAPHDAAASGTNTGLGDFVK